MDSTDLAIDSAGRFLFVSARQSGVTGGGQRLFAFMINQSTGALAAVPGSPFAITGQSLTLAVHPSGKFLYVGSDNILGFAVDPLTGALQAQQTNPDQGFPIRIKFSSSGKFMYVAHLGDVCNGCQNIPAFISGFTLNDQSGALTPIAGTPFNFLAADIAIDPSDKFLYLPSNTLPAQILTYRIDSSTGALTSAAALNLPQLLGNSALVPTSVATDPSGNFVYVTSQVSGVLAFKVDSGGALSQFQTTPTPGTTSVINIVITSKTSL